MATKVYDMDRVLTCVGIMHFILSKGLFDKVFGQYEAEIGDGKFHIRMYGDGRVEVSDVKV